jgi:hypothetical protein
VRTGWSDVPSTFVPSVISCCHVPLCEADTGQLELPGVPWLDVTVPETVGPLVADEANP